MTRTSESKDWRVGPALITVAVLAALLWVSPQVASAQSDAEKLQMMVKGRVTYRIYCTSCHGPTGMGDGNLAQYLNVPPADLTALATENGGEFPNQEMLEIVDGRKAGVRGHGAKEMPVWGDVFKSLDTLQGDEDAVAEKIAELVVYLESIQATGAE